MESLSWLTAVLVVLFAVSALAGWRSGLVRRLLEFAGAIVTVILAVKLGGAAAALLVDRFGVGEKLATPLGPLAILILGFLVSRVLAWLVSSIVHMTILAWADRVGGAVLGLATGVTISSLLLFFGASLGDDADLSRRILTEPVPRWTHDAVPAVWKAVTGKELDPQDIRDRVEAIRERIPDLPLDDDSDDRS